MDLRFCERGTGVIVLSKVVRPFSSIGPYGGLSKQTHEDRIWD